VFFHEALCFVRIPFFFEINDCNVCIFLCESYGDGAANSTVAASDERHLVSQFFTATMLFVLCLWSRPHFMFAAGLLLLMLRRLKFLFLGHKEICYVLD
jgi:hypothetical protein